MNPAAPPVLLRLERVASTQDLIHQLAGDGAPHGTAVVAVVQTAGRGSRGQGWHSPPGGLWLSVLCRPPDESATEVLSLRAALLVAGALERTAPGFRLGVKWPNDLFCASLKVGGILCEARWQGSAPAWVAVGLGLNVTNPVPAELTARATTLARHVPGLRPEDLVDPVVRALADAGRRPGSLDGPELADFQARDGLRGRTLTGPVAGLAEGITPRGELRVRRLGGEISLLRTGPVTVE